MFRFGMCLIKVCYCCSFLVANHVATISAIKYLYLSSEFDPINALVLPDDNFASDVTKLDTHHILHVFRQRITDDG